MILTAENYFSPEANGRYISVSQFKAFEKCPACALAEIREEHEREETTSLLVGSYVDSYFENTLEQFREEHPEIFRRDGGLKSEYVQAEKIIARIERDPLFMEYLTGEKQRIMTGVINGVDVKIKIDVFATDKIVDLKIMKDFGEVYDVEKGRLPWFEGWGYDIQGAVYQEIVRQNTGKKLPFYLAAATKEKEPDIDIVHIGQMHLDHALERFSANVAMYDAIKQGVIEPERCEKCEYCKKTKVLTEPTEADTFYFI
jgi:hypothetical protein